MTDRQVRISWLLVAILTGAATVGRTQTSGAIRFTDVTGVAGVALEGLTTESVAWGDYDNDGDEDLYLTNDGPNRLFRNDGDDRFTDVTLSTGVGSPAFSVGAAFGDLDNDGDLDLYVVNFQRGLDVLYRNDGPVGPNGTHVFSDATVISGTVIERSSRGVALLDFDRDGLLDIYVMSIGANVLYWNQGNLTFVDLAAQAGVEAPATGVGVVASDVDGDGWLDIFTGNRSFDPNRLFLKDTVGIIRKVFLHKSKPQDFERSEKIVVIGRAKNDEFHASEVLMKCPSKYNEEEVLKGAGKSQSI